MPKGRILATAVAAVTMVAVAAPADAQRYRRHHHRDRVDGGDVLLGAAIAGGLIALISSGERRKREREAERYEAERYEAEQVPPPAWLPNSADPAPAGASGYADITSADDAADACAGAALAEGQRHARVASIGNIDTVDQAGTSWTVRGSLMLRDDYRKRATERGFQCIIAGAGGPTVRIDGYAQ